MKFLPLIPAVALLLGMVSSFDVASRTRPFRTTRVRTLNSKTIPSLSHRSEVTIDEDTRQSVFPLWKSHDVQNDEQAEVDEYLVFLDRRYNRLRSEEKQKASSSTWIQAEFENSGSGTVGSCQDDDDALCALGVAGLASTKLRQKFQSPGAGNSIIVPTATLILAGGVPSLKTLSIVWASVASFTRMLSRRRKQLTRNQEKPFHTVVAFLSKGLTVDAVRSARAVWRIGGGMRNITWTVTVMTALIMLLVRPLAVAVGKGTMMSS